MGAGPSLRQPRSNQLCPRWSPQPNRPKPPLPSSPKPTLATSATLVRSDLAHAESCRLAPANIRLHQQASLAQHRRNLLVRLRWIVRPHGWQKAHIRRHDSKLSPKPLLLEAEIAWQAHPFPENSRNALRRLIKQRSPTQMLGGQIDARNVHRFKRYASHRIVRKQALRGMELRAVVFDIEPRGRPIQIAAQRRSPRRAHIFRKRHFRIHRRARQTIASERIGKAQQHGQLALARRSRAGKNEGQRTTSFLHAFERGRLFDK